MMTCTAMLGACGLPSNLGDRVLIFGFCVLVLFVLLTILFLHITNLIRIFLLPATPPSKCRHIIWFVVTTVCGVLTRLDVFPFPLHALLGLTTFTLILAQYVVLRDQRRQSAAPKSPPLPPSSK